MMRASPFQKPIDSPCHLANSASFGLCPCRRDKSNGYSSSVLEPRATPTPAPPPVGNSRGGMLCAAARLFEPRLVMLHRRLEGIGRGQVKRAGLGRAFRAVDARTGLLRRPAARFSANRHASQLADGVVAVVGWIRPQILVLP